MNSYYNGALGSEYWINSYNKEFTKIQKESFLINRFSKPSNSNKIIKPINMYAFYYSPFPEILKNNNEIILRQKTHAEIWVEPKINGLYALDKTWQRQFYPSDLIVEDYENCFNAVYKFYTPWVINDNLKVKIKEVIDSPFKILTKEINFKKITKDYNEPQWINFLIKKNGDHMKNDNYGIIDINTNAFDIIIDDISVCNYIVKDFNE